MHEPKYHGRNPIIFSLVEGKMKVLDIGCAAGLLGKALREEKDCLVVGLEIDRVSVELAKTRLDKVTIVDIVPVIFSRRKFELRFSILVESIRKLARICFNIAKTPLQDQLLDQQAFLEVKSVDSNPARIYVDFYIIYKYESVKLTN